MTNLGSSSIGSRPECRGVRQLLGVYVVGAIEPAERSLVDAHLSQCQACRDELAGLAGLPAMLSRVPVTDVEQLTAPEAELPWNDELPPALLNSLLAKIATRRRRRLWKGAVGIAAAAAVFAGSAAAAVELTQPAVQAAPVADVARASNAATGVAAVVNYTKTPWGSTAMRVQVSGITPGTTCQFWVVGSDGKAFAGQWTVQNSYGDLAWYPATTAAAPSSVRSFQLTAGGKLLLNIPAT